MICCTFVLRLVSQLGETGRERIRDDMSWTTPLDSPVVEREEDLTHHEAEKGRLAVV